MAGRRLLIALVASLALNLFLLGAGAVALLLRPKADAAQWAPASVLAAAGRLEPKNRDAFRLMLRREGRDIAPDLKAARAARREAAAALAADPVRRADALAALDRARAAETRARASLETAVVDFAQQLTPPERQALSGVLRRGLDTKRRGLGGKRERADHNAPNRDPSLAGEQGARQGA
ncbi:MAG TPA: periplasmic heavy metal sensor [Caulobacteraceae bacterium]|jgi:uncharacterized membrane protein